MRASISLPLPNVQAPAGAFHFIVGIILNQNIRGEQAWKGVVALKGRLDLSPAGIAQLDLADLRAAIAQPPAVHPFADAMAAAIYYAAVEISAEYGADARRIWHGQSTEVVMLRLVQFRQIGEHKALVAAHLLADVYHELDGRPPGQLHEVCPALSAHVTA